MSLHDEFIDGKMDEYLYLKRYSEFNPTDSLLDDDKVFHYTSRNSGLSILNSGKIKLFRLNRTNLNEV